MGYYCSICKEPINEESQQYSTRHFGKALCIEHQKTATPKKTYICSECKQTIIYEEHKFSVKNFEKPLCRDCLPEIEEKLSAPP
jgi:hypothetical protein